MPPFDATHQAPPRPGRLPAALGVAAALAAALALWWRFGEGVYGQALLNAFIACF
jgi:hypothetical protein